MAILEIACFDPEGAIIASQAGADRIELCDDQQAGGISPPIEWLQLVKKRVSIPVFVMVRPRGGDFHYTQSEFEQMKADLDCFKQHGANGFVLGLLSQERRVDVARTAELVQRAHPLPCTFHRAFDDTQNLVQAFKDVMATGCRAILSSGGASSAVHGLDFLRTLTSMANGQISIIPGGGVRSKNLAEIQAASGAAVFHSAAVLKGGSMPDATEICRMKQLLQQPAMQPDAPSSSQTVSRSGSISDSLDDDDRVSVSAVSVGGKKGNVMH